MLNVDIYSQLVPNPTTMIVQLCSTLVLFLLVKKYLWKSIKSFLQKRSDKMQEDLTAGEEQRALAASDRESARKELNEAGAKGEQIVSAAVKQAQYEKESILNDANKEADALRKKAHEQIEAERAAMYSAMQKEMVEVALSAAGKLIGDKAGEDMDRKAVDAFVKEATAHE